LTTAGFLAKFWEITITRTEGTLLMDFDCIEMLLDLPEFHLIHLTFGDHQLHLHLQRQEHTIVCPRCQRVCERIKESRTRCIRDLPIFERPVMLWLQIRRFQCQPCQLRPWEVSETFDDRVKWTERLYHQVRAESLQGCPGSQLARRYGLSERTVFRWTFEKSRGGRRRQLGRAIGIDEYSRRKGHNYNTLIVDLDKGEPIDTFKGRRAEDVIAWFKQRSEEELKRVEVVVLDMSKAFYAGIREIFGDTVQVIDRFHVVKYAVDALDQVIRSVHRQLNEEEKQAFKKLRKRWLTSKDQLDVEEWLERHEWRRRFPELREMLDWVQDLRLWFDRKYEKPAREALLQLIERAKASVQEPLVGLAGTLERWFEPIVRYIRKRYTNGPTEGLNNKIKLIQRMAYGLRNERNRRKRILARCGKT
jgi:transposase